MPGKTNRAQRLKPQRDPLASVCSYLTRVSGAVTPSFTSGSGAEPGRGYPATQSTHRAFASS